MSTSVPLAQWIARWTSNPKVLGSTPRWDGTLWSVSVVVITSALHAEGRQFEPGTDQYFYHAYILHLFLLKKVLASQYMLI